MIVTLSSENVVFEDGAVRHLTEGWKTTELNHGINYVLYGCGICRSSLQFLIDPLDDLRPVWYSADSFVILNGNIPSIWQMAFAEDSELWTLIIGDELLCSSIEYFDGLLERSEAAISHFSFIKKKILKESA